MPSLRPLAYALLVTLVAGSATPDAHAAKKKSGKAKAPAASTNACSDFYAHANSAWLKSNTLLPGVPALSAMEQLGDRTRRQQVELLDAAALAPRGNVQKLLGDFWASGLDEAAVERDGAAPVAPLLGRINAIKKAGDVSASIAALHQVGIPVAFNFGADIDLNDLNRHIGYFSQGGLGLPDPAYYTRGDADTRTLLGLYNGYVQKILVLTGTPADKAAAEAQQVIDLETRIAQASKPLVELRSPRANYAPVPVAGLGKTYRKLQLAEFLKAQGVKDDAVSIANPQLFAQLDKLVGSLKPAQWKTYLRWRVGDAMAPYMAKPWRDASFDFRGRVLGAQATAPSRQQVVLDAINLAAGPMLGHEYVARYLPPATRARAEEIATEVRTALADAAASDPRLGDAAKAEAEAKIEALKIEVGAPRRDLDYSVQPMGRGSFGSNMLIASTWHHREEMKRIGRGNADRRWDVLPQQPALAYDLAGNRLIVTAAVLQPPVLDPADTLAAQYGAFGALAGRELSHAIDNKGRLVDAKAELRDWWSPAEAAAWDALGSRFVAQYSGYAVPLAGGKLNGNQVRDIAIADQAGVELAWIAFNRTQPIAAKDARQAFFNGWAHLWPQQLTKEAAVQLAASSVYPPGQWRVNGPLYNLGGFGDAFGCKAGTAMQAKAEQRNALWPSATPAAPVAAKK
ncbi:M13-type metalloendopeptidase [Lysobacter solisilvae (ex Woo and Kim 2020)]|uniref:M13 family metallopeptidase n=1 Tax=Agrilutibacter terrestris TaxID=2865112 RepID=A0A7H0FVV1_9GAMM|nr:M13 family metallopeptidase [Lysobacter terrestris]QNP40167.1 M13 family metallopeptidase [Lysobacter terrestris]